MSQSDYIRYKKTGIQLKINKLDPILNNQDYIAYTDYNLENTVTNSKINYNHLAVPNTQNVFNMERPHVTNCPTFKLCKNTNTRPNRVKLFGTQITPTPIRKFVKDPSNPRTNYKIKCKCKNVSCICTNVCPCPNSSKGPTSNKPCPL